jgi:anti-sigma regulatory factor (Ser/Thr protein kinase)
VNQPLLTDIRVPGGPCAPSRVRSALETRLGGQLCEERLADIRLLATEVVSNSVRHGGVGEDGWVSTSVSLAPERVRIEVRDSGTQGEPVQRLPNFDEGGGFGLYLVDRIASRWGVDRESGMCVWFELARGERVSRPA